MNASAFCFPGSFRCVDALAIDLLFAFDSVLWLPGVFASSFKLGALATGYFFENLNIIIKTSISTTRKREI
jgi:hypothetical protein